VLLLIMPGDAGYGSALLGYHYDTWRCSAFITAIVFSLARSCCSTASFEEDKAVLPATAAPRANRGVARDCAHGRPPW